MLIQSCRAGWTSIKYIISDWEKASEEEIHHWLLAGNTHRSHQTELVMKFIQGCGCYTATSVKQMQQMWSNMDTMGGEHPLKEAATSILIIMTKAATLTDIIKIIPRFEQMCGLVYSAAILVRCNCLSADMRQLSYLSLKIYKSLRPPMVVEKADEPDFIRLRQTKYYRVVFNRFHATATCMQDGRVQNDYRIRPATHKREFVHRG
jgi:hypothetical protein